MDGPDREWVYAGVGCVVVGALLSIASGKQHWFAMGGIAGAAIVGYRYFDDRKPCNGRGQGYLQRIIRDKPEFERLGAGEMWPPVEQPNVGGPQPLRKRDVEGYPMAFRVPDTEVHIDSMDYRIRPHFVGPLGPENDPVRYW